MESCVGAVERFLERIGDADRGRLDLHLVESLRLSHERTFALSLENESLEEEVEALRGELSRRQGCQACGCREKGDIRVCFTHSVDVLLDCLGSCGGNCFRQDADRGHSWVVEVPVEPGDAAEHQVDRCTTCDLRRYSEWGTTPSFWRKGERTSPVPPPCRP